MQDKAAVLDGHTHAAHRPEKWNTGRSTYCRMPHVFSYMLPGVYLQ